MDEVCPDSRGLPKTPQPDTVKQTTYNADSVLSKPAELLIEVFTEIIAFRGLIWILFVRDLKAQFRQSYFGYIWLFLPPVMTTAVWLFLNSQKVIEVADTGIPYPLFVILGSVVWQTFVKLIQAPMSAFEQGRPASRKKSEVIASWPETPRLLAEKSRQQTNGFHNGIPRQSATRNQDNLNCSHAQHYPRHRQSSWKSQIRAHEKRRNE